MNGETVPAPGSAAPDADLIRRMADEDDVDAFAVLFERHRVSVYRAALALTGDPGASEEVVMDTFRRAYIHRAPAAHRRVAAAVAAPGRPQPVLLAPRPPPPAERARHGPRRRAPRGRRRAARQPTPSGPSCARSSARASSGCPTKHRAVVILYYLEGRSLQETADALGLPLGTVKSRAPPRTARPARPPAARTGASAAPGARPRCRPPSRPRPARDRARVAGDPCAARACRRHRPGARGPRRPG